MEWHRQMRLDEAVQAEYWEWCRNYIEHECILRTPQLLVGEQGQLTSWQFYLPVASLSQQFGRRSAALFWDRFAERLEQQPFQIAACESGGVAVACWLQAAAHRVGMLVNLFAIRRAPKDYGLRNRYEGIVLPDLPVLIVDDVMGSGSTLKAQANHLAEAGLRVTGAFVVASCKRKPPVQLEFAAQQLDVEMLFGPDDFVPDLRDYVLKYGKPPAFAGSLA